MRKYIDPRVLTRISLAVQMVCRDELARVKMETHQMAKARNRFYQQLTPQQKRRFGLR